MITPCLSHRECYIMNLFLMSQRKSLLWRGIAINKTHSNCYDQ